jgi:hypothetical protein
MQTRTPIFLIFEYKPEPEPKEKPSRKNNDVNIGIISLILIVAFAIYIIWTIIGAYAYGESDFVLEMNNPSTSNDKLTLFAIEGKTYREICPSGQCKLDENIEPFFGIPTPLTMSMRFYFDFTLKDTIPNLNVGSIKKEYLEKFSVSFGCRLDDIIENNGQEIYTCHNGSTTITRTFDSKSWDYHTIAIYDAKKRTVKAIGNYTGS